jgi:hypothetical protein
MLHDDVSAIMDKLDRLLQLPRLAGQAVRSFESAAGNRSGTLDWTCQATDDLQRGILDARDEDTAINGFLRGEQQAHRREAVVALRAAGARLEELEQTLELLPEPA